jgi:tRNA nucleotidyltransferase (CCA-adding enzyme)
MPDVDNRMELEARAVLRTLAVAGYEAYFVGGCVRDKLLGYNVKDIDIATSALPEQVMSLFPHTVPTGLQHGTVTVVLPEHTFEVTTYRTESGYEDFRRPTLVAFVSSLEEDLKRRDFTMNAMAMAADGAVIDPFGGRRDLEAGLLRCVGEAEERFGEDALRMMRCIRFAAAYGLDVEPATWRALLHQAPLLRHVAMERNRAELERMVEGRAPERALELLAAGGLWRHWKEPSGLDWSRSDWAPPHGAAAAWAALRTPELRWAALWLRLGADSPAAKQAMLALVFAKKRMSAVLALLDCDAWLHARAASGDCRTLWKRAAVQFGREVAAEWLELRGAVPPQLEALQPCVQRGAAWLGEVPITELRELAVTGNEVKAAVGAKGGPWLGTMLQELLVRVALGELPNEREPLLEAARGMRRNSESGEVEERNN